MKSRSQGRIIKAVVPIVLAFAFPGAALAHFDLLQPPPADNATDGGKGAPPCGPTSPSNVVTPVQGGHPLAISLSETVMHPGHYRFALSINSRSEIPPDPAVVVQGGLSDTAAIENPAVFPVLADDVFDHTTGTAPISWKTSLDLPNITCAKCTLQVIEFMAEHTSNPGGGYFYHHCADLKITADPSLPLADAGVPTADASASGGAGGAGAQRDASTDARGSGGASGSTGGSYGGAGGLPGSGGSAGSGGAGGDRSTGGAGGGTGGSAGAAGSGVGSGSGGAGGSTGAAGSGHAGGSGGTGGSAGAAGSGHAGGTGGTGGTAGTAGSMAAGGSVGMSSAGGTPSSSTSTKSADNGGSTGAGQQAKSGGCSVIARAPSSATATLAFALTVFLAASRRRRPRRSVR